MSLGGLDLCWANYQSRPAPRPNSNNSSRGPLYNSTRAPHRSFRNSKAHHHHSTDNHSQLVQGLVLGRRARVRILVRMHTITHNSCRRVSNGHNILKALLDSWMAPESSWRILGAW